ncbi:MAG: hypothetical protein MI757_13255, partial [Pirellulales bacterium]|nr:hypothetical protein [Pirellulales bacterium]
MSASNPETATHRSIPFFADMKKKTFRLILCGLCSLAGNAAAQSVATVLDRDLFEPHSVAVVDSTEMYVTDSANNRVVFYNPDTDDLRELAGTVGQAGYVNAQGVFARFSNPQGVIVARGGLVVADSGNHVIRFVSFTGEVSTLAGPGPETDSTDRPGDEDGPAA